MTKTGLLPPEQKALSKGTRGCLDAEVKRGKRDLAVAWVDFRKAFDQVPNKWL